MIARMPSTRPLSPPERLALLGIVGAALVGRVALPAPRVFRLGWIAFSEDAWYHMRVVDDLVRHWPHRLGFDPYALPGGQQVAVAPLFDHLVAATALLVGLGAPDQALVDMVGALVPAVLGAAAVLLVGRLGARLFSPPAGLVAAALLAVMPGPFLDRTLVGFADHHALETTLVLATLVLLAEALAPATAGTFPPGHRAAWAAGLALGAYALTWPWAAMFVLALWFWLPLQALLDTSVGRPATPVAEVTWRAAAAALALLVAGEAPGAPRYGPRVAALALLLGSALLLRVGPRSAGRPGGESARRGLLLCATGVAAVAGTLVWRPDLVDAMRDDVGVFLTSAPLVAEATPLLWEGDAFAPAGGWAQFGPAFPVGAAMLVPLAWRAARRRARAETLLLVWTALVLAATLARVRFGYYLAPLLALLAGWAAAAVIGRAPRRWPRVLAGAAVTGALLIPSAIMGRGQAAAAGAALSPASREAFLFLRGHAPEPFPAGDPLAVPSSPPARHTVLCWWDDGYPLLRIARRVPTAIGTQSGAEASARFFTATTEPEALAALKALRASHVVVGRDLVYAPSGGDRVRGKFHALAAAVGAAPGGFTEEMLVRGADGRPVRRLFYHPDYYRSMAVRLYVYGTRAVTALGETWVVKIAPGTDEDGHPIREVVDSWRFPTYERAAEELVRRGPGPFEILGIDPFRSCVPLPALTGLRLVKQAGRAADDRALVRVYEVRRGAPSGRPGESPERRRPTAPPALEQEPAGPGPRTRARAAAVSWHRP